ncbi:MAG: alpha/beta hydrolase [Erysipelothrix sp.]|nr:alpha/beta hydrolase [Erysipelothrix sp.]
MVYTLKRIKSHMDGHAIHYLEFNQNFHKGTVMIVHGMEDDKYRYEEVASMLFSRGFNVFVVDIRGHGDSPVDDIHGYFGENHGWLYQLRDMKQMVDMINEEIILVGHSMGSLFVRSFLKRYPYSVKKVVLSGTPAYQIISSVTKNGLKLLSRNERVKKSQNHLVQKIMFDSFNKGVKNSKTQMDWLSFDEKNVSNYLDNPLCGQALTTQGFIDLFELLEDANNSKALVNAKREIDVLFMSGLHDLCGLIDKKGLQSAVDVVKKWGYDAELFLYERSRHEIFFDVEKDQVLFDLVNFVDR